MHSHDDDDHSHLTDIEARVRALESLLSEKGYIDSAAVDKIVQTYEKKIGPQNGAHVVAKAWTDPAYSAWLKEDATAAIHSPTWYKSPPFRSRAVIEPRAVLADFGLALPVNKKIEVHDSTAEIRYLVIPERPENTDALNEQALAKLVTRNSMIGTAVINPAEPVT